MKLNLPDTATTFTPSNDLAGPNYYYVVVNNHAIAGAANCNVVRSPVATSIVWDSPIINMDLIDTIYCSGARLAPLSFMASSTFGSLTYRWFQSNTRQKDGERELVGVYTNRFTPTLPFDSLFYYVKIYNNSNLPECNLRETKVAKVTITPTPVVPYSDTFKLCSGDNFYLILTPNTANTSINWTRPKLPGVDNEEATGSGLINERLFNSNSLPIKAYTFYQVNLVTNIGCRGSSRINILLKPTPQITNVTGGGIGNNPAITYCSQFGSVNNIRPQSYIFTNFPNTNLRWYIRDSNNTFPKTSIGNSDTIPSIRFIYSGSGQNIQTNAIVIRSSLDNCEDVDSVKIILAPPIPHQKILGVSSVCLNTQPLPLSLTNANISDPTPSQNASFIWQVADTNFNDSFRTIPFTNFKQYQPAAINRPKYYRVLTSFGCQDSSAPFFIDTLSVPRVKITSETSPIVSFGNSFVINVSGAVSYTWKPFYSNEFYNENTSQITLYPNSLTSASNEFNNLDTVIRKYVITGQGQNQCFSNDSISISNVRAYQLANVGLNSILITPNNDGINDLLYFQNIRYYGYAYIEIYDIYNNLMFTKENYQQNSLNNSDCTNCFTGYGNYGKFNGVKFNTGNYLFKLVYGKAEDANNPSKLATYKGSFSLITN